MKVDIREQWRCTATLRCPLLAHRQLALFQHARSQPFLDEAHHAPVSDPMLDELHQPVLRQSVEKCPDVHIEYPVHLLLVDPDIELIQRIVLASPRSESVREFGKVLFVDRVHHLHRRPLDNLVLQRRYAERSHPPVAFRNEPSPYWLGPIRSSLQSMGEVLEIFLPFLSVVLPRLSIHAGGRIPFQLLVCVLQHLWIVDVVEQRGESGLLILPCHFSYPFQRAVRVSPALGPERVLLVQVPFGQVPSLHPLRRHRSGFVRGLLRYYGPVRLPVFVHHRLLSLDFPIRPDSFLLLGQDGISPFPCIPRPYAPGPTTSWDSEVPRVFGTPSV